LVGYHQAMVAVKHIIIEWKSYQENELLFYYTDSSQFMDFTIGIIKNQMMKAFEF